MSENTMKRESFVFYASFYESLVDLPEDVQLQIYKAVCKYALEGELPELTGTAKAIFTLIRPQLDASCKRYDASVENGKKGGRPPKSKPSNNLEKPSNNLGETYEEPTPNHNVNVNVNDNVNANNNISIEETSSSPKNNSSNSSSENKPKRKSLKDQLLEYIDALEYEPETKDILKKWIFAVGIKGNVTVSQLQDKLKSIWAVYTDEKLVRDSINEAYLNNWFGFFPLKQQQKSSSPTFTPQTTKTPEITKISPATVMTRPKLSSRPEDIF